jgi:hypothetical protein
MGNRRAAPGAAYFFVGLAKIRYNRCSFPLLFPEIRQKITRRSKGRCSSRMKQRAVGG